MADSNPYELVIKGSKGLEAILATQGATGKGLHEKVDSVESRLPVELVKRLRFIATVRNRVVHEEGYELKDPRRFSEALELASNQLLSLSPASQLGSSMAGRARSFKFAGVWILGVLLTGPSIGLQHRFSYITLLFLLFLLMGIEGGVRSGAIQSRARAWLCSLGATYAFYLFFVAMPSGALPRDQALFCVPVAIGLMWLARARFAK